MAAVGRPDGYPSEYQLPATNKPLTTFRHYRKHHFREKTSSIFMKTLQQTKN